MWRLDQKLVLVAGMIFLYGCSESVLITNEESSSAEVAVKEISSSVEELSSIIDLSSTSRDSLDVPDPLSDAYESSSSF